MIETPGADDVDPSTGSPALNGHYRTARMVGDLPQRNGGKSPGRSWYTSAGSYQSSEWVGGELGEEVDAGNRADIPLAALNPTLYLAMGEPEVESISAQNDAVSLRGLVLKRLSD